MSPADVLEALLVLLLGAAAAAADPDRIRRASKRQECGGVLACPFLPASRLGGAPTVWAGNLDGSHGERVPLDEPF